MELLRQLKERGKKAELQIAITDGLNPMAEKSQYEFIFSSTKTPLPLRCNLVQKVCVCQLFFFTIHLQHSHANVPCLSSTSNASLSLLQSDIVTSSLQTTSFYRPNRNTTLVRALLWWYIFSCFPSLAIYTVSFLVCVCVYV